MSDLCLDRHAVIDSTRILLGDAFGNLLLLQIIPPEEETRLSSYSLKLHHLGVVSSIFLPSFLPVIIPLNSLPPQQTSPASTITHISGPHIFIGSHNADHRI